MGLKYKWVKRGDLETCEWESNCGYLGSNSDR